MGRLAQLRRRLNFELSTAAQVLQFAFPIQSLPSSGWAFSSASISGPRAASSVCA